MRGPISSFVAMLGTLRGILTGDSRFVQAAPPVQIAYDGAKPYPPEEALILLVTSLERLFLGVRPYWASGERGMYSTLIRTHPRRFLQLLPAILRGSAHPDLSDDAGYRSRRSATIQLSMSGRFTLDGDIYTVLENQGPLRLEVGPKLRFLQPL